MTAASTVCRSCGSAPQEGSRFCDACGSRLVASVEAPEYKQVTVLFADVVHSMDIAAAIDIERLREIMTELLERSAAVVHRYGGTVEHTGDGVMALFGAPVALEDHAFRACVAALNIQEEAIRLAAEVTRTDGVALQLRVGLNSGRVIAGEIGSGSLGYAATGEHVGMAQRMEAAAPAGGVLLSESTAQHVEDLAEVTEPVWVRIKGTETPVRARRLVGIRARDGLPARPESSLVGRCWEMAALDALVDRTIGGCGGVVNVVGPPGIGKSRVAREAAALAASRGVEVFWTFCESHANDIPFQAVARLLRAGTGVIHLDGEAARVKVRQQIPDADPQDLLLLDDLLGIADPDVTLPQIDPDARRRRLTARIKTAMLARTEPAVYIIEDAHWIDAASESMIADLLTVVPRTPLMVLVTTRFQYEGALTRVPGAQTIALAPLADSDTTTLLNELLGTDPSLGELAATIAERAAGNPFFAEEMVRELVQRGVLTGERSGYFCRTDVAEVSVPGTVQAAIEARIDRLNSGAKRTLHAASVIGGRFGAELLTALGIDPMIDELVATELVDQITFTPHAEYIFHHPLIRAVAYESQLKADRTEVHRRLAAAIEAQAPQSADFNAVLIAEHLEAAGELRAAYAWHMRAGGWSTNRDIAAARVSWERARQIADALPDNDADRSAMRIAPRTMLCVSAPRVRANVSDSFAELRELCTASGDKASLAAGMTAPLVELLAAGCAQEASRLASEQLALLESIGDPTLTVGLAAWAISAWFDTGEIANVLRWSQTIIDLAGGDPARGASFGFGSPLAVALASRGTARWWLGRDGWHDDYDDALVMARNSDPLTYGAVIAFIFGWTIFYGVRRADDSVVHANEEALKIAEDSSDDTALGILTLTLGVALVSRDAPADRRRGLELLMQARDMWLRERDYFYGIPLMELYVARESARNGNRDSAVRVMREVVDGLLEAGRMSYLVIGAGMLVETLLAGGAEDDLADAQEAIDRLAHLPATEEWAVLKIMLLRLRARLSRARGDKAAYLDLVSRYREMAESLGFEGHIEYAEAMIDGGIAQAYRND
ncbi:MAG TPA: AAA family ATPase [Mycobacterium sp.]|nr:AAA family ATPase [Mycobacterium sp.]